MKFKDVLSYVSQLDELSESERESLLEYMKSNEDEIFIDSEVVEEGPYNDDYYNVTVDGPDNFYLVFEKGCDTDHLSLLELNCIVLNW